MHKGLKIGAKDNLGKSLKVGDKVKYSSALPKFFYQGTLEWNKHLGVVQVKSYKSNYTPMGYEVGFRNMVKIKKFVSNLNES